MVQVDIVWSYAFGATFAAAASRQLADEEKPFDNKFFTYILFFLGALFAPSGLYLLWQFPHWETMQVATTHKDIPSWLVVIFGITNITQGIIGYWVGYKLIRMKNIYGAYVNWVVAWIIFWSILVMGWDTTGWQRFLYDPTVNGGALWTPGTHMGIMFFTSNVFLTLVAMALPIGPALAVPMAKWIREGITLDSTMSEEKNPGYLKLIILALIGAFGITLSLAIINGFLVFWIRDLTGSVGLAYLIGLPLFWIATVFLLLRRNMPLHRYAKLFMVDEPLHKYDN